MQNLKKILQQENVSLIDVRHPWEFDEGHINGAINIPLDQVPARVNDFKKLNGPAILYCRSGSRSAMAVNMLRQAGISHIYNGGGLYDMQLLTLN
jgi:phage shock protein E